MIRVLLSTFEFCWELGDCCSYMVLILDPLKYDYSENRYIEIAIQDMLQMIGRASRYGID
jgi:replicative superfamily II helicase